MAHCPSLVGHIEALIAGSNWGSGGSTQPGLLFETAVRLLVFGKVRAVSLPFSYER